MEFVFTAAGFAVGTIVGLTGVGGGALMTPFLVICGVAPSVAVGTDLIYAAITKCGGICFHHRAKTIDWRLVRLLAMGSLPATLLALCLLGVLQARGITYEPLITSVLSISLIATSLVVLFRDRLDRHLFARIPSHNLSSLGTPVVGFLLGITVTLSSIGAGAIGAAMLMLLYSKMRVVSVVGTDLAHAALLAGVSGVGHLGLGTVDFALLGYLLLGSLPGIALGTHFGRWLPEAIMRRLLGTMLFSLGIGFAV